MVDGLDTMWVMGLHDEFREALPFVANMTFALDEVSPVAVGAYDQLTDESLPALQSKFAPFFETVRFSCLYTKDDL